MNKKESMNKREARDNNILPPPAPSKYDNEVREEIKALLRKYQTIMNIRKVNLKITFLNHISIVDCAVYAEAFPLENKIIFNIFAPDASPAEIEEVLVHELTHIKHPDLRDGTPGLNKVIEGYLKRNKEALDYAAVGENL